MKSLKYQGKFADVALTKLEIVNTSDVGPADSALGDGSFVHAHETRLFEAF